MTEVSPDQLKQAVEAQHGGRATFVQSVPITETLLGQVAWEGTVHIFDLAEHPLSTRAYAWSYELPDGKRRFYAVLDRKPITSPRDAVRAAIVVSATAK